MDDMKKEWIKPTLTKVKLEFDKEMSSNCQGSGNSARNKCQSIQGKGAGQIQIFQMTARVNS